MQQTNPSGRRNRVLIWLLSVLGIVAIAAVSLVVLKFDRDSGRNSTGGSDDATKNPFPFKSESESVWNHPDKDGYFSVSGFISEMTPQKEIAAKTITLVVAAPSPRTGKIENLQYKFLLSNNDTIGAQETKAGDSVTVHFAGAPSETSYMLAKKVEVLK